MTVTTVGVTGSGYGSGDGSGDGSGYGYGYGYGSGDGSGYGYGYGYGDGSGYGYGYGYEILAGYDDHPVVVDNNPDGLELTFAFWRSDRKGLSANGGTMQEPARPGLIQEVAGPLALCSNRALHGSLSPGQWNGDRWWLVALFPPVVWDGDKCGSLKRLIVEEL